MEWEAAGKSGGDGGQGSMPPKKSGRGKLVALVVAALVLVFVISRMGSCGGGSSSKSESKDLAWPTSGLATMLPEPPSKKGTIWANDDEQFIVDLDGCDDAKYADYVEKCKDKGFTIDAENTTWSYEAYSKDGSHLSVAIVSESMSIDLDAPIAMGAVVWPVAGPASLVPAPASATGKVDRDSSTYFYAYVGETDAAAYTAYVDTCIAAGYSVDYHKGDTSFYADNANGVHVSVDYLGFNTMTVKVDTSKMTASDAVSAAEPEAPAAEAPAASTSSSSSDVREALDAYEAFMNEYCDFMEKYAAEGHPVSMLADYGTMMTKYADAMAKFDAIDEESLSADDDAYYLEVQGRVLQRLATVGQ